MKKLLTTLMVLMLVLPTYSQVKGNGKIITEKRSVQGLTNLKVNLYANVVIDMSGGEMMTITGDENLIDKINLEVMDGTLDLNQLEWIQPSEALKISISSSSIQRVEQGTHERTIVENMDVGEFKAMALVGSIKLKGKAHTLFASGEIGEVDASELETEVVQVNMWGYGKILAGAPKILKGSVENDGRVIYRGKPTKLAVSEKSGGKALNRQAVERQVVGEKGRFIRLTLKNNSSNRINCYVVGPKPDGKRFSYGFPMSPGQSRKKDWSIGSKVYRVSAIGTRKLLRIITANDEGQVVNLYE